ncbi:leucine-rich repeat domain-containing protein [Candidatus Synchoanobacter obligatus]|uniref:Leucine-rich repeat domain-containing protein n=1 Tax=Candidatus Synchoanobacter obligatus TaxID=2919597 RepID=A0ABT1L668_9GAMM|nr:leucine-rich repeat domain-containing protein [Candidatus Synchoanobacter obligatus]
MTSIGYSAFSGCTSLTEVEILEGVTSIGEGAFEVCAGLTQVTIPDSVTSIGGWAFWSCTGLTSVTIPDSVTSIGYEVFFRCTSLTSVTIPDSVTSIEGAAFARCEGLTSVTIPNSVTSIGDEAFMECTNIRAIQIAAGLDLDRLRRVLPSVTEFQVEPIVTRKESWTDKGYFPNSIKGKGTMQFAKLLFLCGERIARINNAEEIASPMSTKGTWVMQGVFAKLFGERSGAKLPTLPPEIWLEIMSWVYIEPVPKKVKPISSDALLLTDDERKRVDQYKQSFNMVDSEDTQVRLEKTKDTSVDSVIILGAIVVAVSALHVSIRCT